jgi:fibro-slime domain-containing protein
MAIASLLLSGDLSSNAHAAGPVPAEIELNGIVRDFIEAHPDMEVAPAGGNGHFAGNVDLNLGTSERPTFVPGGDGMWLFVDGFLAIDLGGMDAPERQYIQIDRLREDLGLVNGESYRVHLFYAQRVSTNPPAFSLRTNIPLSTHNTLPAISAAFD